MHILLADDHRLVVESLRAFLENHGAVVVGLAADGLEAKTLTRLHRPDLLLVDMHMPGFSGLEVGRALKQEFPTLRVILLSMHNSPALVRQAKSAGFDGYLVKNTGVHDLLQILRHIHLGGIWFPQDRQLELPSDDPAQQLTPREIEVLRCIAQGTSSTAMAIELSISLRTVETHRKNIIQKMGTKKVSDLVQLAQRLGLI